MLSAVFIVGILLTCESTRAAEAALKVVEIDVETDTYVQNGAAADSNFSDSEDLRSLNSDDEQSEILLRFAIPKSGTAPDSAFIWVRTTSGETSAVENAAYLVSDDRWIEKTVTWNTKPAAGEELDAWITDNDHTIKIDVTQEVTDALKGDGRLSIAIKSPHNIGAEGRSVYHSLETPGSLSSKLVIRYNEAKEYVLAGDSIQNALDAIHERGGGQVILSRGKHHIKSSLTMYSDITLRGMGAKETSILMDRSKNEPILIASRKGSVIRDFAIRKLTLDGQQSRSQQNHPGDSDRDSVRGESFGMLFTDQESGNKFERVRIQDVIITRCAMGIHFKGVDDLRILDSEIHGNGCLIGYDHNIYFRRASNSLLKNLNISDCTAGNGFNLSTDCVNIVIDHCNASNNNFRGIRFEASDGGTRMMIIDCTTNNNGRKEKQPGIRVANVRDFVIMDCIANNNGEHGIYCVGSSDGLIKGNRATGNKKEDIFKKGGRNVSIEKR